MLYNILKVLGVCFMIIAYFGGFIIAMFIGIWIIEKIDLYFYKKKMEMQIKYVNSIYNNRNNNNILHIDSDDTPDNES